MRKVRGSSFQTRTRGHQAALLPAPAIGDESLNDVIRRSLRCGRLEAEGRPVWRTARTVRAQISLDMDRDEKPKANVSMTQKFATHINSSHCDESVPTGNYCRQEIIAAIVGKGASPGSFSNIGRPVKRGSASGSRTLSIAKPGQADKVRMRPRLMCSLQSVCNDIGNHLEN
jgi:hypothetical protein